MRSRSSAKARRLASGAAVVALATGCASGSAELGADAELTVYVSAPLTGPDRGDGQDIVDGAGMALDDAGGEAGGVAVRLEALDSAPGSMPVRAAANARTATHDSTAIAYLGDFESGATRASLPVTNEAHLLQVSAASTANDLVAPFPGSDDVPEVQASGERTFARVIPSDEAQAGAGAEWAAALGWRRVAVVSDGSSFGRDLADGFRAAATEAGVEVVPHRQRLSPRMPRYLAGYAGGFPDQADDLLLTRANGEPAQMASDAFLTSPADALFAPDPTYVTSSALDPSQLPVVGREFVARFEREHGQPPGRYAAYGYEGMAAILDAIDHASDPADRDAVVDAFFETTDRASVLGTYSIDDLGETTLDRVGSYRLAGVRLVAARALRIP